MFYIYNMVYLKIEIGWRHGSNGQDASAVSARKEKDGWTEVLSEVERMKAAGRFKTAANYLTAARSWSRYVGSHTWRFSEMTPDGMGHYQQWLCERGLCHNTVSAYMRCLRAMYRREVGSQGCDPFAKVFTGRDHTSKRSVTADVVMRLHQLSLPQGSALELARDLFLFAFQAMGMPFVDMAYLKKAQVKDGVIRYARHKTGQQIIVPLTAGMTSLMRRHETDASDYVFPILTQATPDGLHRQYRHALRHYNYLLRRLADLVGVPGRLSSYVVRHSWASIAYQHHLDIGLIGKALGHTKSSTTMIYIKSLFDKDLATANETLLREMGFCSDPDKTTKSG